MFKNRIGAGQRLAEKLEQELSEDERKNLIVLSIPRGGVVVGNEIAKHVGCPHDVIVTKKLRAPMQSELAIGAVGETSGSLYINKRLLEDLGISDEYLEKEVSDRQEEIRRREKLYRQSRKALDLKGKIVLIVDDGAATGATVVAAAREAWERQPKKVVIGLPVVAKDTLKKLEKEADAVVFLSAPEIFYAVGQFYQEFEQVSDEEVVEISDRTNRTNKTNRSYRINL